MAERIPHGLQFCVPDTRIRCEEFDSLPPTDQLFLSLVSGTTFEKRRRLEDVIGNFNRTGCNPHKMDENQAVNLIREWVNDPRLGFEIVITTFTGEREVYLSQKQPVSAIK